MKRKLVGTALALALLAAAAWWLLAIRVTPAQILKIRRDASREVRALKPDAVLPRLERMAEDYTVRSRFSAGWPFITVRRELRVPADQIGYIAGNAFIRFAGGGFPGKEDQARIVALLDFAERLAPRLGEEESVALKERMLDAHFMIGDFDGAVAMLESGMPGRSKAWTRAAVAKVRAHQAEANHDDEAALRSFIAFGEAIASEPDGGLAESDPTTGVAYCRAWVLGKNARRVAELQAKLGRVAEAERSLAEAKRLYVQALKETADDPRSLQVLKAEAKTLGL